MPVAQFRVAALINDSVGTLAGGCYVDADTKIGVILGTGTNACYVEHSSAIAALARSNGHGQRRPHMAINTEWGNYDASSTPYTDVRRTSYTLAWVQHHASLRRSVDECSKKPLLQYQEGATRFLGHTGWTCSVMRKHPAFLASRVHMHWHARLYC